MIKAAIEKITQLVENKTYNIEGRTYSDKELYLIEEPRYKPTCLRVNGLDSICKLIRNEIACINKKIYVQAKSESTVEVFTTYNDRFERTVMYSCTADVPAITSGRYMNYENAIIELRSLYIPNEGTEYLLSLLSSISKDSGVTSSDNGVTQMVEARTGIALNSMVEVRPRVDLKPFRTFLEVKQPESEFLLRINENAQIGLFPADGGVWKLEAKRNIAEYFENALSDLVKSGDVVVIM